MKSFFTKLELLKLYLQGWRESDISFLRGELNKAGLLSSEIYQRNTQVIISCDDKFIEFPINPLNEWGELIPVNNRELSKYYSEKIQLLQSLVLIKNNNRRGAK